MTVNSMRLGLAAFAVLAGAAIFNMVMLQPIGGRSAATRATAVKKSEARPARTDEPPSVADRDVAQRHAAPRPAPEAAPAAPASPSAQDVTRAIQRELRERGYETGAVDGQPGLMTRASIMAYEHDRALPLTGEPTPQLLKLILLSAPPVAVSPRSPSAAEQSMQATQVIRTIQQSLMSLGYAPGKADGRLGDETVRAIREFETAQGLPETGRVSGQLVARLSRLAGQGRLATGR